MRKKIYAFCMGAMMAVPVMADGLTPATFEDLNLANDSYWQGVEEEGSFTSGSFTFDNSYYADWSFWCNFGYSSKTANTFETLTDQWNSAPGGGHNSATFCVAYPQGGVITLNGSDEGEVVSGFYITNNAYAYSSMMNGDGYAKKFEQGDWFKVTIKGLDAAEEETGSVDFYLADFRSENEAEHYILNTWKWVDLTALGKVKYISFTLSSTDTGEWGINTPAYFCMDDLGATPAKVSDFEDLTLEAESSWNGSDGSGAFVSGDYTFMNVYNTNYGSWSGWGYTNSTSTSFTSFTDMFNSAVGSGVDGSNNYALFYYSAWDAASPIVNTNGEEKVISGFYVTNNAYAKSSMENGDAYAKKFAAGDWFKLTATGKDAEGNVTGTVDYYLADFRSENVADHYILDTWKWVDLTPLGKVVSVEFTMSSSDVGDYGMNTPSYFCMDNFNGEAPVSTAIKQPVISGDKNAVATDCYDISGKRINAPQRGLNIIRMSDGTVRKVMIK